MVIVIFECWVWGQRFWVLSTSAFFFATLAVPSSAGVDKVYLTFFSFFFHFFSPNRKIVTFDFYLHLISFLSFLYYAMVDVDLLL